jgi:hypothetical protein
LNRGLFDKHYLSMNKELTSKDRQCI